jgi:hypothetical protein
VLQAEGRMSSVNICFLVIDPQKHNTGCLTSCSSKEQWHLRGQYVLRPKPAMGLCLFRRGWIRLHRRHGDGTSPSSNLVRKLLCGEWEIWVSHSSVAEDLSLLGCYAVSTAKYLLTFWGITLPSFRVTKSNPFLLKLLTHEDKSTKRLRNIGSYNSNDKALAYIL